MNYPESLKKGDTIGICAPSGGITKIDKIKKKYVSALTLHKEYGIVVKHKISYSSSA